MTYIHCHSKVLGGRKKGGLETGRLFAAENCGQFHAGKWRDMEGG